MSDTSRFDQVEEQVLDFDVSDEALESVASSGHDHAGVYTLGSCTGFYSCPGG
jgi:hypothetical protein